MEGRLDADERITNMHVLGKDLQHDPGVRVRHLRRFRVGTPYTRATPVGEGVETGAEDHELPDAFLDCSFDESSPHGEGQAEGL